jgi:23S rRNA (pseudouridine1915-N3)-methyltransferase
MKITLLVIGKSEPGYIVEGILEYLKRLKHYIPFVIQEIPALKKTTGMPPELIMQKEAEILLRHAAKADCLVLLDENGKEYSSTGFSGFLQQRMNSGVREMMFVIGGAWGFAPVLHQKADYKISLSRMTFSHQMVRLFFAEQLYRAFTILKGESYHNE